MCFYYYCCLAGWRFVRNWLIYATCRRFRHRRPTSAVRHGVHVLQKVAAVCQTMKFAAWVEFFYRVTVPVFAVRLEVGDQVTRARLHRDGLSVQGDDVGGDLRPVTVGLLPLQLQAGGWGRGRLRGGRQVQEGEGGDRVRVGRRRAEVNLLAVGAGAGLVHRL